MGMSLNMKNILLTKEEYNSLQRGTLYIKNGYDLELISAYNAFQIKNSLYFESLANELKERREEVLNILKEQSDKTLEEIIEFSDNCFQIETSEMPLTLEEWLDTNELFPGEWVIHEVKEEKKNGELFYIMSSCRYW